MALSALLDNLDGLTPDISALYKAHGDKFLLDVTTVGGFALEDVSGLKSSLGKERTNARAAKDKLTAFGDMEPQAAMDALAKVVAMENWTPEDKVKEQIEAREKQLHTKHKTEMDAVAVSMADLRDQLEDQLIEGAAIKAITEHGGSVPLLLPHIRNQTKLELVEGKYVVQVMDAQGSVRVSMKSGSVDSMDIDELVVTMRDMESFAPAFAGSGASGSGAAGSPAAGRGGAHRMTFEQAHSPEAYQAAKAAAAKAGVELQLQPFVGE